MPTRALAATVLVALALSWTGAGCSAWSADAKKAKHRERGLAYFQSQQYQEAVIEYKNVVQLDPKDADAHYHLALSYLRLGGMTELQQAFVELKQTVEIDPANRDAQIKLGELYLLSRDPKKARERAELVLASAPQDAEGLMLRGRSLIGEEVYDEGIAALTKAIELDPHNLRAYLDLSQAHLRTKNVPAAEAALKRALAIHPKALEAQLALGDLRVLTGQSEAAGPR